MRRILRIERHAQGPRVRVFGWRVHDWHVGGLLVAGVLGGRAFGWWGMSIVTWIAVAVGVWLVLKDWRDLVPWTRDTGAWGLGIHRRFLALRPVRRGGSLPTYLGAATVVMGVVNVASALTPNLAWRGHVLLSLDMVHVVPVMHALALPAGAALIVMGVGLSRRRRRAWAVALGLLVVLGVLNLLKGLDVEEALASWALAVVLWWAKPAFYVEHDPLGRRAGLALAPLLALAATALIAVAVVASTSTPERPSPSVVLRETGDLLLWRHGPMAFHDEFSWLPVAAGIIGLLLLPAVAYALFRPLAAPRSLPDPQVRRLVRDLVGRYGEDTLSYFNLRADRRYLFSPDRRAVAGYRVAAGVLVLAGDPIGPEDEMAEMVRTILAFAERRGLKLAVVGASERLLALYGQAGLRPLYIGDEAIVLTEGFSLEGHAVKKLRQAVNRVARAGYRAEVQPLGELTAAEVAELERVSESWRDGVPERGFSMALDRLDATAHADTIVVTARDGDGRVRGFLHFVPVPGRPAMSLSFMRRERDTPNGLTEFLVVRAIEALRERGVAELSLNFAAFARWVHAPATRTERLLGRVVAMGNPFFQIESLYRFNAKFAPRWAPRYLLFEGSLNLLRAALAALWLEGQLPRLRRGSQTRQSGVEVGG